MRFLIAGVSVLALAACSSTPEPAEEPPVQTFTNPVFADNFPDPGAILVDGVWHAYGTNNPAACHGLDRAGIPLDLSGVDIAADARDGDQLGLGARNRIQQRERVVDAGVDIDDQGDLRHQAAM